MSPESRECRGDALVARLLAGAGVDSAKSELLAEFQRGYPVHKLRALFNSPSFTAVGAGTWIASELGTAARPLFQDIATLAHHPSSHVRFFVLDCLLACARSSDGDTIFDAMALIEDPDPAVRWKALVFLATLPGDVLKATRRAALKGVSRVSFVKGIDLLLASSSGAQSEAVLTALDSSDPVLRSCGAAAAARHSSRDPSLLKRATESADPTVKQFADDMVKRIELD
jgi:hypothetical protein